MTNINQLSVSKVIHAHKGEPGYIASESDGYVYHKIDVFYDIEGDVISVEPYRDIIKYGRYFRTSTFTIKDSTGQIPVLITDEHTSGIDLHTRVNEYVWVNNHVRIENCVVKYYHRRPTIFVRAGNLTVYDNGVIVKSPRQKLRDNFDNFSDWIVRLALFSIPVGFLIIIILFVLSILLR